MVRIREKAYNQVIKPKMRKFIRKFDKKYRLTELATFVEVKYLFEQSKKLCLRGVEPKEEYKRIKELIEGKAEPSLEAYHDAIMIRGLLPAMLLEMQKEIEKELLLKKDDTLLIVAKQMIEEKIKEVLSR